MTETLTQTRFEDAIANTNDFLIKERGTGIDGGFASSQIAERITSVAERVKALLSSVPHPKLDGLYVPLSKYNSNKFSEAAAVLPGHMVLLPSSLIETGTSVFYPAVVSEDGLKTDVLRLHVLKQPYRQQLSYGASVVLSAAGQSETKGIGDHGRSASDGVEAEHFATLLAAGNDAKVQTAWQSGQHVNHTWREGSSSSVTSEVFSRLFGKEIPQTTTTITRQQIEAGQAMILWHKSMEGQGKGPETATKDQALVIVQALGYEALKTENPKGLNVVKRLIA